MIILHNPLDKDSRDFVEVHKDAPGVEVYDWYSGGRESFWSRGGTKKVSAFPSVVVFVPEHDAEDEAGKVFTIPAHQEAIRKPADKAEVETRIEAINQKLARSRDLGKGVVDITVDMIKSQLIERREGERK